MGAGQWLKERIPVSPKALWSLTNEPVPGHLKIWWFALGGTPAILLLGQIATGLLLCVYYQPTSGTAWESVKTITQEIPYGWWFRSLHKWGANLMIVGISLHLMRVFFTGAYRRPREINWMIGSGLFLLTLMLGFTGYSLIYEQLSYWGATVAANIMNAVPFIGPGMAKTLRGGEEIASATITRFFILHVVVLPALLMLLLSLHIVLIRLHGVTEFPLRGQPRPQHYPFIPEHLKKEISIGLVLLTVVTCLSVMMPVTLGPKADPLNTPEHIKPEWYYYFTFRWLKLTSLSVGIAGTGLAVTLLVFWPFVDALIRKRRPNSELSMALGAAAILIFLAFTVWEALT